jgi:hypothetical protein
MRELIRFPNGKETLTVMRFVGSTSSIRLIKS